VAHLEEARDVASLLRKQCLAIASPIDTAADPFDRSR
jgi:hypothetical protein